MKFGKLMCSLAITLLAALATPVHTVAQEQEQNAKERPRYKLIDIGTFGGPNSYFGSQFGEVAARSLNSRGVATGFADTPTPDPNPSNCFGDCYVSHTLRWQNGALIDLGALPGINSSGPNDINAKEMVTGISQNGQIDPITGVPEFDAVIWKKGQIIDLGTFGGNFSYGAAINNAGQVVGVALNAIPDSFSLLGFGTQTRAFLWENGVLRDLGTLGGPDAWANDVNDRGQITGWSYTNSTPNPTTGIPTQRPFLWENGTMLDLGSFGGTLGTAGFVNSRGQVIGNSNLAGDIYTHGFLWDRRVLTDLGTLGGNYSFALWINNVGAVVGSAFLPGDNVYHAFLWRKGVLTDLRSLDGAPNSVAFSINSEGQVVGGTQDNNGTFLHAFLWENRGPMIDLNTLIPPGSGLTLNRAASINDRGEISATATLPNGDLRAVLLIPCDGNDTEGCEDNAEGTTAATQNSSAPVTKSPTTSQGRLTPGEMVAAWRARLAHRYKIPGLVTWPRE